MGQVTFGAPREVVLWLSRTLNIRTFVETGTNRAETAVWAADHFDSVVTVEGYKPLYEQAVNDHGHRTNIQFIHGDSREHIESVTQSLLEPAIFWLDAHWCGEHTFGRSDECPVIGELEALNTSSVPHIILIDDARLFIAPPPAPHQADHWPNIATLCDLLTSPSRRRYVAIHADVIVAVPESARVQLIDFIRSQVAMKQEPLPQVTEPHALVELPLQSHKIKQPVFYKIKREIKRLLIKP